MVLIFAPSISENKRDLDSVLPFTAMKAIRVSSFGGPEVLKLVSDVPIPSVSSGQVRVFFLSFTYIDLD